MGCYSLKCMQQRKLATPTLSPPPPTDSPSVLVESVTQPSSGSSLAQWLVVSLCLSCFYVNMIVSMSPSLLSTYHTCFYSPHWQSYPTRELQLLPPGKRCCDRVPEKLQPHYPTIPLLPIHTKVSQPFGQYLVLFCVCMSVCLSVHPHLSHAQ